MKVHYMRKLFCKLFPPYEVKLTIQEAESFIEQAADLSRNIIKQEVVTLARNADKTIYSIRIDRMKPDQLALLLITNVIGRHLGSGDHHTYRGVLNMVGQDMLKVWHSTQKAMLNKGYVSEQEVNEDNQWIREQIKNAG